MSAVPQPSLAHTPFEDAFAILTGTIFIALGIVILKSAGLGTGGTAGLGFLIAHGADLPFGPVFFALNLPFFVFAWLAFGWVYLARSVLATGLLSLETTVLPRLLPLGAPDLWFAALIGGLLIGMGLLALIRHRTGIGGFAVMAVWLQERFGWRAGKVQMAADALVVAAAFALLPATEVCASIFGVVVLDLMLALYHRPGRYNGF